MNEDSDILEILLELAEDENKQLKSEIEYLQAVIRVLKHDNKDLVISYNNLIDIKKRLN